MDLHGFGGTRNKSMGFPRAIVFYLVLAFSARAELPSPKVLDRYRQMLSTNPVEGTALDRLWKAYSDAGQTGQLIDQYRKGGTFASEMVLGHLLRRAGELNEAGDAFVRAAKLQPQNALPALALARLHKESGRPRESAESFEKAAELLAKTDTQLPDILFEAGQAWITTGDVQRGAAAWERAVALAHANTELRRRLAENYVTNGLPERAVPHLEYLVQNASPSDRAQALQQLARVHRSSGNIDAAKDSLEKAIALTLPGNWLRDELQSQLIRLHQRAHRIPELEDQWKRHAAENPRDLGGYLQLIALYDRLGDLEAKRGWLEKLVKLAPKTAAYRLQLARLYAQLDQLKDATALYDQLLAEQPANSDLVFERARIDILLSSPDMARQRIGAILQRRKAEESIRAKALEFFQHHRIWPAVEEYLITNATNGQEEAVLALAEFLFSQGRDTEAETQLRRLVRPDASPDEQGRAWIRITQTLKAHGLFPAAIFAVDTALASLKPNTPARREALLLSGELHRAAGDLEKARTAFAEAVQIAAPPSEQVDAEQKLFDCLRQIGIASGEDRSQQEGLTLPSPDGESPILPNALSAYISALRQEAENQNTEAAWLRLAQWHMWCRDQRSALDAANKAIVIEPKSIAAHEFIVKLSSAIPTSIAAHWHLGKLMEVDQANRGQYMRRIAQLNLQGGNLNEALRSLQQLAKEQPGNLDVLTDLAMAQQRAEHWQDALATWKKILAESPAARRAEIVAPVVRIYERLHQPAPAAEILLKEVESEADPKKQLDRFSDLLSFATKHNLLQWLQSEWEKRSKRFSDDYVTEIALGRILKARGERAKGFQILVDAALSAPDPSITLPDLVREAEEIRKLDDAVRLQEQLVKTSSSGQLDAWLKLAELQEKTFSFESAGNTWLRIVARFPRDVSALFQAAEFWQRDDNRENAIELLRRVRALEPANSRALWLLARLNLDRGNFDDAKDCLEQILLRTTAEKPGEPVRFPALKLEDGTRLQNAYLTAVRNRGGHPNAEAMRDLRAFWAEAPTDAKGNEKDLRLNAIRELARIIVARNDPIAHEQWVSRWNAVANNSPSEALWALYYSDAGKNALALVEELMRREPTNVQQKQAFIWLALQTRQGERLATWLRESQRTATDRDFLMIALGQHLDSIGSIDPSLLDQLFPPSAPARLWQAATLFASRMRFAEAIRLGSRALSSEKAGRSRAGLELAHWHLSAGDIVGARNVLANLSEQFADSFDSPSCAATRELYLLLPPHERGAFAERKLALLHSAPPVHAAIMGTLLNGLDGNIPEAQAYLNRLLEMRVMAPLAADEIGNSSSREWTFYLSAGLYLQAWKLGGLAAYLWEKALADPALVRLEGDHAREISREMRTKLAALNLARISPQDATVRLEELLSSRTKDEVIAVGDALESLGALTQAIVLYRTVWERDPSDPQPLRNLLNACRMADDQETTEAVLRTCISDRTSPNDTVQRDFAGQLADLLERKSDITGALKVLVEAAGEAPGDLRLLQRLAQLHEKAGNFKESEAAWKQLLTIDPTNVPGRAAVASLLERQGDLTGAISILSRPDQSEADPLLPILLLRNQQTEAALDTLRRVPGAKLVASVQNFAQRCIEESQQNLARIALQEALERITDPAGTFQLRSQLIETFSPAKEASTIVHQLRSLRRHSLTDPKIAAEYYGWLQRKGNALGVAEFARKEFEDAWAGGRGPLPSGVALLGWYLEAKDFTAVESVLKQLLARPETNSQLWDGVLRSLEANNLNALATVAHERITRLNPLEDRHIVAWARTLALSGQKDTAIGVVDKWGTRAWLDDEFAGKIAQVYAELGARDKADALFTHAIRQDLPQRNFETLLNYARIQRDRGNLSKAHHLLTAAFRHPACRNYDEIVAWSASAGRLGQLQDVVYSLQLSPAAVVSAWQALFKFYESQNKVSDAIQALGHSPATRTRDVLARLRTLASRMGAYSESVTALEGWLTDSTTDNTAVSETLTLLYADWADAALNAGTPSAALKHLKRANELRGEIFAPVQKLVLLYEQQGNKEEAAKVLNRFIDLAKDPTEREQARKLVKKLEHR